MFKPTTAPNAKPLPSLIVLGALTILFMFSPLIVGFLMWQIGSWTGNKELGNWAWVTLGVFVTFPLGKLILVSIGIGGLVRKL